MGKISNKDPNLDRIGRVGIPQDINNRRRREKKLTQLNERLEIEVRDLTILQTLSRGYLEGYDFDFLLQEVVEAAVTVTGADKGNLQLLDFSTGALRIVAHKGFGHRFLKFFEKVEIGDTAACRVAVQRCERVIVEDIISDPIFKDSDVLDVLLDQGVRAVQSTPLISRSGRLLGILSTHFRQVHTPAERELQVIDVLARLATDIIEHKKAEEERRKARDELEIRVQERTAKLEEANKELKQSRERNRTLIDNIQDGVFIIQDGKLRYVNEAFARIAGYAAKDVIGKDFAGFIAPEDREMVVDRYRRRIAGENVPREYEFHLIHKDGKTRLLVNTNVGVVSYHDEKITIGTLKDITEKKRLEAQLQRTQRMESIGRLAGGIAHDINNLLTPTTIFLHLMKEKITDEESQKVLDMLEKNTWRAADLMEKMLIFARGVEVERKQLQVSQIIQEIEKLIRETFPRNIDIRTQLPRDLWITFGDTTQIHQVLMNLCLNARDAMPEGGVLTITAENTTVDERYARANPEAKLGSYVVITVSDTGTGIPVDIRDKIFEPFFTTKEQGKGGGLGLSTSLGIVKSHGGFIDVYGEVEKGSVFKVYLPAIAETTEAMKQSMRTREEGRKAEQCKLPKGHGEVVLIAEDEQSVLETTKLALERHGYKTVTAKDGAEAVDAYAHNRHTVNAVLLDMMMPVMDGDSTIKILRKINPTVRIIAVSGFAKKDRYEKSIEDTQAFLGKPYTVNDLLRTIHQVLIT